MHKLTAVVESLHTVRETNKELSESTKATKIYMTSLAPSKHARTAQSESRAVVQTTDLDAAIAEVKKRLQYLTIATQVEASMKVGYGGTHTAHSRRSQLPTRLIA